MEFILLHVFHNFYTSLPYSYGTGYYEQSDNTLEKINSVLVL